MIRVEERDDVRRGDARLEPVQPRETGAPVPAPRLDDHDAAARRRGIARAVYRAVVDDDDVANDRPGELGEDQG